MKVSVSAAKLMVPHFESNARLDELAVVWKFSDSELLRNDVPCSDQDIQGDLVPSPFMEPRWRQITNMIRDLASSFVRQEPGIIYEVLLSKVKQDPQVSYAIEPSLINEFVDNSLRMIIANKGFIVSKKSSNFTLNLGNAYSNRENQRKFAASLAEEIGTLSDRMAAVVPHMGEQGRFREDLLRSVLEKNLPSRYHVATGFIEGCGRQLDILIYDQIDYVPLFREAGVVVVPPEAVRAVIEVKTTLNAEELNDALGKIADVALFDDCNPPFFKGVFAYRGPVKEATVTNYILDYYRKDSCEDFDNQETVCDKTLTKEEFSSQIIMEPFKHLTALCVDRSYFAEVLIKKNKDSFMMPTVQVVGSKTDLTPQTALFVESLNEYLQIKTIKKREPGMYRGSLAHDLKIIDDQPIYTNYWGPYFEVVGLVDPKPISREIERQVHCVESWLLGEGWSATK